MRNKEVPVTTTQEMARQLLPVIASRLVDVPYVIIAHSVGCWNAYEFLCQMREVGMPMPLKAFLSAMASPDIPVPERPWRQQKTLTEDEFKEEARFVHIGGHVAPVDPLIHARQCCCIPDIVHRI
jgi:surfactin synthase thioesterase subunit